MRGPDLDFEAAREAVEAVALRTPLLPVPSLREPGGELPGSGSSRTSSRSPESSTDSPSSRPAPIHLKLENLQVTGSFKVRGAAARMAVLTGEERGRGVVACSSGNHGRAVVHVARSRGIPAVICVPEWVDPVKREAMEELGGEVILAGETYDEAEERAKELEREGRVMVHPFDDLRVIAGQGTVGLEIVEQLPEVGTVVVPLSGGGLAGGIAAAVKRHRAEIRIVAASAARAPVMVESVEAGRPVEVVEEETLASALSGGIGRPNRYTFELIRDLVDVHVRVTEEEIARAMVRAARDLGLVVEGGGAVALAALLARKVPGAQSAGPTVAVVSGGNVELSRLARLEARIGRFSYEREGFS